MNGTGDDEKQQEAKVALAWEYLADYNPLHL